MSINSGHPVDKNRAYHVQRSLLHVLIPFYVLSPSRSISFFACVILRITVFFTAVVFIFSISSINVICPARFLILMARR
jgi:hypothetical protein